MKTARPPATNQYQEFRYSLEQESPRAAYWLEAMVFGIMAQLDGMTEDTALELACKIVAHTANPGELHSARTPRRKLERMPAERVTA
jgi:hypothetical protein